MGSSSVTHCWCVCCRSMLRAASAHTLSLLHSRHSPLWCSFYLCNPLDYSCTFSYTDPALCISTTDPAVSQIPLTKQEAQGGPQGAAAALARIKPLLASTHTEDKTLTLDGWLAGKKLV